MPILSLLKKCSHAIVAASLFVVSAAQASVISFEFTGTIAGLGADLGGGEWGSVTSSNVPGELVSVGDTVHGRIFYDTTTPISYGEPGGKYITYASASGQIGAQYTVAGTNLKFASNALQYDPNIHVRNEEHDGLTLSAGGNLVGPFQDTFVHNNLELGDTSGTALNSAALPTALQLGSFQHASIGQHWMRNNAELVSDIRITSLTPVALSPVPEPHSYAMMLAGLGLIGFVARRKSAAGKHLAV